MAEDQSAVAQAARRKAWWRRRWVNVGEVIGLAGLAVAGLSYWDAHRDRSAERAEKAVEQKQAVVRAALVLTGSTDDKGARITLSAMKPTQAVQSQRYLFPRAVLDHAMEVDAAQPQIDRAWVEDGLKREVEAAAKARDDKAEGEGSLPVGVVSTYVEDGETRTDRTLYRIGFKVERGGLLGGSRIILQGLSLIRRTPSGDLQAAVEASWKQAQARGLAR